MHYNYNNIAVCMNKYKLILLRIMYITLTTNTKIQYYNIFN